jgi:hypothetical protein
VNSLIHSLEELEKRIIDLLSSGLDNSKGEWEDLLAESEAWREIGFAKFADEIAQAAREEGKDRFTRLFLLQRQIDWLKWRLAEPGTPDEGWKKRKAKKQSMRCLPLSRYRDGDRTYFICLVYSDGGSVVFVESEELEPFLLRSALEVKGLRFRGNIELCEGISFPVYQGDMAALPDEDISDYLKGPARTGYRLQVIHQENRLELKYIDLLSGPGWWSYEPLIELSRFEENYGLLKDLKSLRVYGCLMKTRERRRQFWPLFVTRRGKAPGESPVLHVHDRIWSENDTAFVTSSPE